MCWRGASVSRLTFRTSLAFHRAPRSCLLTSPRTRDRIATCVDTELAAGLCASFGTDTALPETRGFGTLTTDASGAGTAFYHSYGLSRGAPTYYAPIVSLTDDQNPPGAGNVAYEATLAVVNQMLPPGTTA